MHAFYFGTSNRRLFAVYHPANGSQPRDVGVVFCHPVGHEYIRSYRAFRNLAIQLSDDGYHVLRFDYYATGDSAGDSSERSVQQAIDDVGAAIDELKDMADVPRVSLIGLRFGATLALLAGAGRDDVDHLVLWDPVADGNRFLGVLTAVQQEWFRTRPGPKGPAADLTHELIGYPLEAGLVEEFQRIDVREIKTWRAGRVTVLASSETEGDMSWRQYVRSLDVPGAYHLVPGAGNWDAPTSVNRALLAHDMIKAVAAAVNGREVGKPSAQTVYKVSQPAIGTVRDTLLRLWEESLPPIDRLLRYRWYYLDNPSGPGAAFLVHAAHNGSSEAVGCTGVSPRTFYNNGRSLQAMLSADFAVDKAHRTVMPAILLQRAARRFGQETADLSYGFPNTTAVGVFLRIGYTQLGTMGRYVKVLRHEPYLRRAGWLRGLAPVAARLLDQAALVRDIARTRRRSEDVYFEWLSDFDERFDRLCEEGRARYPIVGTRSAAWLRWRFGPQSGTRCQVGALIDRRTRAVRAYAVLAPKEKDIARIGDFFATSADDLAVLLRSLVPQLRRRQFRSVAVPFLGVKWVHDVLEAEGYVVREADRPVVVDPGEALDRATFTDPNNWYLTAADTDS